MTIQQWIADAIVNKINSDSRDKVIDLPSIENDVKPFPLRLNKHLLILVEQDILDSKLDRSLKRGEKSVWSKKQFFKKSKT